MKPGENGRWYIGVKTNFRPVWRNSLSPSPRLCSAFSMTLSLHYYYFCWSWFIMFMPFLTVNLSLVSEAGFRISWRVQCVVFFSFFVKQCIKLRRKWGCGLIDDSLNELLFIWEWVWCERWYWFFSYISYIFFASDPEHGIVIRL